jgi:hypothetical protein
MKNVLFTSGFLFFLFCFSANAYCQNISEAPMKDRDWRIEAEPGSFVLHGFNLHVSRNVTPDNKLNLGLYILSLNIPAKLQKSMFENIYSGAKVRLGFETAIVARYKFALWKGHETNPYLGAIFGWEYFDIKPAFPDQRITTWVFTPFAGYEIYLFRERIFVNPQLRGVIYLSEYSDPYAGPAHMKPYFLLPAVSVGVRF